MTPYFYLAWNRCNAVRPRQVKVRGHELFYNPCKNMHLTYTRMVFYIMISDYRKPIKSLCFLWSHLNAQSQRDLIVILNGAMQCSYVFRILKCYRNISYLNSVFWRIFSRCARSLPTNNSTNSNVRKIHSLSQIAKSKWQEH